MLAGLVGAVNRAACSRVQRDEFGRACEGVGVGSGGLGARAGHDRGSLAGATPLARRDSWLGKQEAAGEAALSTDPAEARQLFFLIQHCTTASLPRAHR